MKKEWLEIPVLIHGIDARLNPKEHSKAYARVIKLINKELLKQGKEPFTEKPISVEWGWNSGQSTNDRYLAEAERIMVGEIDRITKRIKSYFFDRLLLKAYSFLRKEVFLTGIADMFYYVSGDGEKAIRNNVFSHISREIMKRRKDKKISLTFISHSAGTVIIHDLLYHLFGRSKKPMDAIQPVFKLAKSGKLRIRRIFTSGSPITPLIFRSDHLLLNIIKKKKLNPEGLGLRKEDNLSNPRWINFWDKDDILSFPLEFLYKETGSIVKDERVNLKGFLFWSVHKRYWWSKKVVKRMAEVF
jgi:hypothetical protein